MSTYKPIVEGQHNLSEMSYDESWVGWRRGWGVESFQEEAMSYTL